MREKLTIASLVLVVMSTATPAYAQDADFAPGSRVLKMQRDHLKDVFGVNHPTVVKLGAQIRRESNAITNPEISVVYMNIEDPDAKSMPRSMVALKARIAKLEKEIAALKLRIAELKRSEKPATP